MKIGLPLWRKNANSPDRKDSWRQTVGLFIGAAILALLITLFGFQSYRVDGQSMQNTLQNDDRLVIDKLPRTLARLTGHAYIPNRGDIVVFNEPNVFGSGVSEQLIKRVIGLPGDRVVVDGGLLKIYNNSHPSGYVPYAGQGWNIIPASSDAKVDTTLGPSQLFVCGDNQGNSTDSRVFGPINADQVIGKLVYRMAPFSQRQAF